MCFIGGLAASGSKSKYTHIERVKKGDAYTVIELKKKYPDFIWNKSRGLELTRSENAPAVTANCPSKQLVLPLYLADGKFVIPYCCHGSDVNCDLCGSWVVFHLAARLEQENLQ